MGFENILVGGIGAMIGSCATLVLESVVHKFKPLTNAETELGLGIGGLAGFTVGFLKANEFSSSIAQTVFNIIHQNY